MKNASETFESILVHLGEERDNLPPNNIEIRAGFTVLSMSC